MINPNRKYNPTFPYKTSTNARRHAIYAPSEYMSGVINGQLTGGARRVLLAMLERVEGDYSIVLPMSEMVAIFGLASASIHDSVNELCRLDVVTRKGRGTYWMNPDVVKFSAVEV